MTVGDLNLQILSEREKEILDLAIQGLTDQQIGNKLDITASTVNSYWVRIRGKVGHLSRTELVSKIVQQRALVDSTSQAETIRRLEQELRLARGQASNSERAQLLRAALDINPEACIVFDEDGRILLANVQCEKLFGVEHGTAEGKHYSDFFEYGRNRSAKFDLSQVAKRGRIGAGEILFGLRKHAEQFRIFLYVGKGQVDGKTIYSCIVRPFYDEIELARERATIIVADSG